MSLLAELKRRNVLRAAAFYAASAWLLVQVATQVFPFFHVAEWVVRWIVIAAVIGFPFAMLFSWFYEWTPHGIQRESEVAQDTAFARQTGKKLDRWIIAVLALAVVLLLSNIFVVRKDANAPTIRQAANNKSIAVLPFESLSEDKDNAYFATGMQDEILTRLASIHDLKVISRTSTEQYASHPPNLRIVAEQLGVATVLEGSVQKADGKVRINLQLIDARSDSHLWAHNYDRDLKDVFAVQSDVAEKVADALKAQLLPAESARIASVPTQNQEAYDQFLKAEYFANRLYLGGKDAAEVARNAQASYESAIAADPSFALAYARLSYLKAALYWSGFDASPQTIAAAQDAATHALALQPDLPEAHLAQGIVSYWGHRDDAAALTEFAIARARLPNDARVLQAIASVHRRQGKLALAIPEYERAVAVDPRNALLYWDLSTTLTMVRRYADAEAACDRALALAPDSIYASLNKSVARQMRGDLQGAARVLAAIPADADSQGVISQQRFDLAMTMRQPDAALAAITKAPAWLYYRSVAVMRGQALALKGDTAAAHAAFLQAQQQLESRLHDMPGQVEVQSNSEDDLAIVYAALGRESDALTAAHRATDLVPMSKDALYGASHLARLAMVEEQMGETDSALDHIRQLLAAPAGGDISAASLRNDPAWDPLRKDPRFQKLVADAEAAQAKIQP